MTAHSDDLDRLTDALDALMQRRRDESTETDGEFLDRNAHLRDLLEPMVQPADPGASEDRSADSDRFLGDYRLLREIGRGGMGVVYEATQVSLGRRVALKVLPAHLTLSARQIQRFRREATAAGKLHHPGIVPIYGVGEAEGAHFFAMELVEGESLSELIRRADGDPAAVDLAAGQGTSSVAAIAELVAQVAEALAFAHDHGVFHRDVKPQNILVGPDGKARLVDFGLAKDTGEGTLSRSGEFAGTPHYMSPEQVSAKRLPVDGRSDVFSLGIVLYELLTARRPFDGETSQHVLYAVTFEEPGAPRLCNPMVPRDLETICLKALEKVPGRRYQTAAEMAEDLRRFLRLMPILARPTSTAERAVRFARRHKAATTAALLGMILLVGAPVAAVYYKVQSDRLELEKTETARQRDLARENLDRARRAVDQLMTRVAEERISYDAPGLQLLRRELLEDAVRFYRELVDAAAGDPAMRHEKARARQRLGSILMETGRREEALAEFDLALGQLEALIADQPTFAYAADRAVCYRKRAHALFALGDHEQSASSFETAVRGFELLAERAGSGHFYENAQSNLATAHSDRAIQLLEASAGTAAAERSLDRAIEIWDSIPDVVAADRDLGIERSRTLLTRGELYLASGRLAAAIESYETAIDETGELLADSPGNPRLRQNLAEANRALATVYQLRGNGVKAIEHSDRACEIYTALVADFPSSAMFQNGKTAAESMTCMLLLFAKRGPEAIERIEGAARAASEFLAANPDDRYRIASVARVSDTLAMIRSRRAKVDPDEVRRPFVRAAELYRRLVENYPEVPLYRNLLGGTLSNQAWWLVERRPDTPKEEIVALLDAAIENQKVALASSPEHPQYRNFLEAHYRLLTLVHTRTGDHPELAATARDYLSVDPGEASRLVRAARYLGRCVELAGTSAEARVYGEEALGWLEKAVEAGLPEPRQLLEDAALAPLRRDDGLRLEFDRIVAGGG